MESDSSIREAIVRDVDHEAYDAEGRIRRKRLAANVFADKRLLLRLNAIVHAAVRMDVEERAPGMLRGTSLHRERHYCGERTGGDG